MSTRGATGRYDVSFPSHAYVATSLNGPIVIGYGEELTASCLGQRSSVQIHADSALAEARTRTAVGVAERVD
jgi:hypothetical protein